MSALKVNDWVNKYHKKLMSLKKKDKKKKEGFF